MSGRGAGRSLPELSRNRSERLGLWPSRSYRRPTASTQFERSENLVEAVGIEPTSEERTPIASTCVVPVSYLVACSW